MTGAVLTFLGAAGTVTGSKFLYEEEQHLERVRSW